MDATHEVEQITNVVITLKLTDVELNAICAHLRHNNQSAPAHIRSLLMLLDGINDEVSE